MKIGDIISIDYSWGEIEIYSEPLDMCLMESSPVLGKPPSSYDIDINVEDIDLFDTVTMQWDLK